MRISGLMNREIPAGEKSVARKPGSITVFGAANMDIGGTPYRSLVHRDSNPGTVRTSSGGVGRNIAHNLRLLGNSVRFVSAFGEDAWGRQILDSCQALGIDTQDSMIVKGGVTSSYLYITREDGDMELAVSDMQIYRHLTPAFISEKQDLLAGSSFIVVDANLPEETIGAICESAEGPVLAETVSTTKALRFKALLKSIHTITPNLPEAEALTGLTIDADNIAGLTRAAETLLKAGVKQVVITLSSKGCFFSDGNTAEIIRPFPARMVNSNGAGDALVSGLVTGTARGFSLKDAVLLGMAAASITVESVQTNNPNLNFETAYERVQKRSMNP